MNILVIAPHPDDEIIAAGGTIAKYSSQGHDVYVCIVTKGTMPLFSEESVRQVRDECCRADKLLGVKETFFLDFPAVMLEMVPRYEVNAALLNVVDQTRPDEVYIPHRGDMHLDHKVVVDAAMVALRPKYEHVVKRIYAYETLSETGWDVPNTVNEFIPTVYQDISKYLDRKLEALAVYESQVAEYPNPRSIKAIRALAMLRGATVNVKAAEAFELVRELRGGVSSN